MSQFHIGSVCDITLNAEADLSDYQYHVVKFGSAAGGVALSTAATDAVVGILQNKPELNQQAVVRIFGCSKARVDGTTDILAGDWLAADSSSHAVKNITNQNIVFGRALEGYTSSTVGIIEVFVNPATNSHS